MSTCESFQVHEAFPAEWEPFPIAFVDLYELFQLHVVSPVACKNAEMSCDLPPGVVYAATESD